MAMSVVFTWLYNSSGGSLAGVILLHASAQASYVVLPVLPAATGTTSIHQLSVAGNVLLAVTLIATFGARDQPVAPGPSWRVSAPLCQAEHRHPPLGSVA